MSIIKGEVSDLIKVSNQQLMNSFKDFLQETVGQMKRVSEDAGDLQIREIKRLKHSKPHKFKRKANEDRYKFNLKLGEIPDNAKSAVQTFWLGKVKSELDGGEKLLLEPQKHILLPDKWESGWFTVYVEEYKKHDLAENSDEEKRQFTVLKGALDRLCPL